MVATKGPSAVEQIKEQSDYLREPLRSELAADTTHFSEAAIQVLKFHGAYQQFDRDNVHERRKAGLERDYRMMLRTKQTAGYVPPALYLTLDDLADRYGYGTLRITTRQAFQMHGILKANLKAVVGSIVRQLGSTLAACGDVERNVMAPAAPYKDQPAYVLADQYAQALSDLLAPRTQAYVDIWVDGEALDLPELKPTHPPQNPSKIYKDGPEPLYGTHYLPRKFKSAVTVPGDNSVDLYTQDLGLIVITNARGELEGFNISVGGGLGRTHGKDETFPLLAQHLGFVSLAQMPTVVQAIVAVQRDFGDRTDRRHARLKYLVHEWGIDTFRTQVEAYAQLTIQPWCDLEPFTVLDYLGWQPQGDGKLFLGLDVANGRVKDEADFRLKTALRTLVSRYDIPLRLTPQQNVLLCDIEPAWQGEINQLLAEHGVALIEAKPQLPRYAMACPAMPTCSLAITESERIIPSIVSEIEALLARFGLAGETFMIRMTGCPNGCARPYMAELGLVGRVADHYQVWLGGSPRGDRLAEVFAEKLHHNDLLATLTPILRYFKKRRRKGESFGDFCARVGMAKLQALVAAPIPRTIKVRPDSYDRLKAIADREGKNLVDMATAAIEAYLLQEKG